MLRNRWYALLVFYPFSLLSAQSYTVGASSAELFEEARQRLETLRTYVPQEHYVWHCLWVSGKQHSAGRLVGRVDGKHHWVEIAFEAGEMLTFDKAHPNWVLYPNWLCFYPESRWGEPLAGYPALNGYLLMMPFLSWPVQSVTKTAKLGRKALQVEVRKNSQVVRLFLDKNFNTILKAEWEDKEKHQQGCFVLKNLKKFPQGWGLSQATFELNGKQTTLRLLSLEAW